MPFIEYADYLLVIGGAVHVLIKLYIAVKDSPALARWLLFRRPTEKISDG